MILETNCPHCGQSIEFEANDSGQGVNCPDCSKEFNLPPLVMPEAPEAGIEKAQTVIPPKSEVAKPPSALPPLVPVVTPMPKKPSAVLLSLGAMALFLIGGLLALGGALSFAAARESAIRQVVYACL